MAAYILEQLRRILSTRHKAARAVVPTLCWAATLAAPALSQSQSGFTYNGIVYTSYQAAEYANSQGPQGAAAIRATGASYTSVLVTQYMQTYTSNTIAPETTSTSGYNSQADSLTPTDSAVAAAIANLQAQGLTVVMKPQVDSLDGIFRGSFAPTDVASWFASYQTFLLHYAALASQNNVGYLIIGTELKSLSGAAYASYWASMIAQLRISYPSLTLIYGANATGAGDEFTTVSFWDKVDIIGVDGYFPLTNHADPTVAQLVAAWTDNKSGFNIVAALQALQAQYSKPLIFTEVGYVSAAGTNEIPYANAATGAAYDPTEQQNCYEAFFEVFSQQTAWMNGVFWWQWNVSPPGSSDTGYTGQNKPAATVTLPKWFGSATAGFTLAASNPILAVNAGNFASDTISVTSQGGFSGAVTLAVTGLPAGISANFAAGSAAGTQTMVLTASSGAAAAATVVTVTGTSGSLTASIKVTVATSSLPSQSITFSDPGTQTVGTPVTLVATASSGLPVTFSSTTPAICAVSGTTATFLVAGTCTLDANQAGGSGYAPAAQVVRTFTVAAAPSYTVSATPATLTLTRGGSGTVPIVVTGSGGYTGVVSLSAVLTSVPQGAQFLPSLSFGSTNPVTITTAGGGTATLTVSTTVASMAGVTYAEPPGAPRRVGGGGALAALLFLGAPRRRRRVWRGMLATTGVLGMLSGCLVGCSSGTTPAAASGRSGTSPGTYIITVTAVSGTITTALPVTLTVQ